MSWQKYYSKQNLTPRPTLISALEHFNYIDGIAKHAMDLGCGNGRDTLALLESGWKVNAIDLSEDSLTELKRNISSALWTNLSFQCSSFEQAIWTPSNLINASYSLPFCHKEMLPIVWNKIEEHLMEKGIFCGHFFGNNDDWKELNLLTKDELMIMFQNFNLLFFNELEEDKPGAISEEKHWHIFEIVAQKK